MSSASVQAIGRMSKLANVQVVVDRSGKHAVVGLPGLTMDDFNRVGRVSVARVLHWFTSSRIAAYHIPNTQTGVTFLEYDRMTSDRYTFMASTRTTVERPFYDLVEVGAGFPALNVELHLGYMGTASLNSVGTLVARETGARLASNVNQVVVVDKVTRTPTAIPDWWRERYASAVVENERLVVKTRDLPKEGTHKYNLKVLWSDTDRYRHTNYQSYVRFCLDAAMDAVDKNFYAGFSGDILRYDVRTIECLYAGESVAGEEVVVDTWQEGERPLVLLFSISTAAKMLFQCSMEFHELLGS